MTVGLLERLLYVAPSEDLPEVCPIHPNDGCFLGRIVTQRLNNPSTSWKGARYTVLPDTQRRSSSNASEKGVDRERENDVTVSGIYETLPNII